VSRWHPLDFRCDDCGAVPYAKCWWRKANGKVAFRSPHAARVTAAREYAARASRPYPRKGSGWSPPPPSP